MFGRRLAILIFVIGFIFYSSPSRGIDLDALRNKIADLIADPNERKIRELEETKRKLLMERLRLEREVRDFMIDNSVATACLFAMGVQAIKFLNRELELNDTLEEITAIASVPCFVYTVWNLDKMERVSKQYIKYASRLAEIDGMIREIDVEIQRLKNQR